MARDYQRDLLRDPSDRIVIVKSRQIGISQTLAFLAAYEAIRGGTAVVISRTGEQAKLFLSYVYAALDGAPHPPYRVENQSSLEIEGAGRVITQGASRGAGRGIPASLLILDEMAWMEYGDDIYTAAMPTLSNGGRAVVCSTPFGRANAFYRIWAGGEGWSRHELPWHLRDDWRADPTWEASWREQLTAQEFAQEYDCDFVASGLAVFDQAEIDAIFRLSGFDAPRPSGGYLTSWDLGRKRDATVGVTFDALARPYRVVAFERMLQASYPDQQAAIERRAARYPGATWVESNGVGDPVIQNLRCRVHEFVTSARSKKDAIDALQLALQRRALASPPIPQAKRELEMYQRSDEGLVQDCVMALAIGAHALLRGGTTFRAAVAGSRPEFAVR